MKRLGFPDEREMQLQLAIANAELCPTFIFCEKTFQCWFTGTYRPSARRLRYQVNQMLTCAPCFVLHKERIYVNPPESATANEFLEFLHSHYQDITIREKARPKHKTGRPKDSDKKKS